MPLINTALTLKDLPPPPPGKTGWPWTEQTEPLPERMPDGAEWPRISIVTPSYNQGQFIEETIRSVLLQGYPNLEYIIIDGGSTDNSIEIIKKYKTFLAYWVSESDRGQSHAINKGFRQATGKLIGWQNSDDYYHSEAFIYVAKAAIVFNEFDIFHGSVNYVESNGDFMFSAGFNEFSLDKMLPWSCVFNQSTFFRDKIFQENQFLDESKKHLMDYEFFWRLALAGYTFKFIPEVAASHRQHSDAKGATQGHIAEFEFLETYKFLYKNKKLPDPIQQKILRCIASCCRNEFGKLRLNSFRKNVIELINLNHFNSLPNDLVLKYIISFFGTKIIIFLKNTIYFAKESKNSFLFRRILTRMIWFWETHRKYEIKKNVFTLPPIEVNVNPSSILAVLTTPNTIYDAAWTAQSLLRKLPSEMGLTIVVDGELPPITVDKIKSLFPGSTVQFTKFILEELKPYTPKTVKLSHYYPLGRKLSTIFYLQQKYDLLFSDADVLCLGEIHEINKAIINHSCGLYLQDVDGVNTDPAILKGIYDLNLDYADNINTGFLYIPCQSLDLNLAEHILSGIKDKITSWFAETTILAVLMEQAKATPLPRLKYIVSCKRQFYFEEDVNYHEISLRHFITPVRHLMYSQGMPMLWKQLQQTEKK